MTKQFAVDILQWVAIICLLSMVMRLIWRSR